MPQLSLYLSEDLAIALRRRADADHRSLSNYVGRLLSDHLAAAPCPDCGSRDPGHATPCGRPRQVGLAVPGKLASVIARTVERGPQGRIARQPRRGK